jgi:hypothetical protein
MADVSGLEANFRRRAEQLFADGVDGMQDKLTNAAPVGEVDVLGRPRVGPRLRETFYKGNLQRFENGFRQEVGFTAPQATFSNDLMPPHPIPRLGVTLGYPLRFWWNDGPRGPGEYLFTRVNHPGNINADSRGWWDRSATQAAWFVELVASQ